MNDDYFSFLAMELGSACEDFPNPSECAHEICKVLSLSEGEIPETNYRLYTSNVPIEYGTMYNAAALFSGAEFLQIDCDCTGPDAGDCEYNDKNIILSPFYQFGQDMYDANGAGEIGEMWFNIAKQISSLKEEIFG